MRDLISCPSTMPEATYKEVVVVGNGPSAMGLSYMLAGNWPYYNGLPHPDDMLTVRLRAAASTSDSLFSQDLEFLSQGLEGRSQNPVSVLLDCLMHPGADAGLEMPPLLQWRHHPERAMDHICLGKGPPGGAWQAMDGNVVTISLSSWMELPGMEWRKWESHAGNSMATGAMRRVPVASVAAYYRDYVRLMRLQRYFRSGVVVTSVRPSASQENKRVRWSVEGYDIASGTPFQYVSRQVVLATGSTDRHNVLGVPGEQSHPEWVFHDLASFERELASFVKDNPAVKEGSRVSPVDPVCIVGAGLSAADAVLACKFHSLPIVHVFRRNGIAPEHTLPENMYPEYHKVHQMMGARGEGYPDYTPYQEHRVVAISPEPQRKVTTVSPDGHETTHQVSLMAALIGSRPDLSFLPPELRDGQTLLVNPNQPLDCRSNPIAVDPWAHTVTKAAPGLYALGPLAGDNFVRYLLGGAVAVSSDILRPYIKQNTTQVH